MHSDVTVEPKNAHMVGILAQNAKRNSQSWSFKKVRTCVRSKSVVASCPKKMHSRCMSHSNARRIRDPDEVSAAGVCTLLTSLTHRLTCSWRAFNLASYGKSTFSSRLLPSSPLLLLWLPPESNVTLATAMPGVSSLSLLRATVRDATAEAAAAPTATARCRAIRCARSRNRRAVSAMVPKHSANATRTTVSGSLAIEFNAGNTYWGNTSVSSAETCWP